MIRVNHVIGQIPFVGVKTQSDELALQLPVRPIDY